MAANYKGKLRLGNINKFPVCTYKLKAFTHSHPNFADSNAFHIWKLFTSYIFPLLGLLAQN